MVRPKFQKKNPKGIPIAFIQATKYWLTTQQPCSWGISALRFLPNIGWLLVGQLLPPYITVIYLYSSMLYIHIAYTYGGSSWPTKSHPILGRNRRTEISQLHGCCVVNQYLLACSKAFYYWYAVLQICIQIFSLEVSLLKLSQPFLFIAKKKNCHAFRVCHPS